jgi:hypothetical protein
MTYNCFRDRNTRDNSEIAGAISVQAEDLSDQIHESRQSVENSRFRQNPSCVVQSL